MPFCHLRLTAPKPTDPAYPNTLKTLGDHLRKKRLDLGLLQCDVGEKLGVTESTIWNWEKNATTPAIRLIPRIIRFLGYNPYPTGQSLPEKLTSARKALGLSQRKLAHMLSVDQSTLAGWETGRHRPTRNTLKGVEEFLSGLSPSYASHNKLG